MTSTNTLNDWFSRQPTNAAAAVRVNIIRRTYDMVRYRSTTARHAFLHAVHMHKLEARSVRESPRTVIVAVIEGNVTSFCL